jgi:hypothetical protein
MADWCACSHTVTTHCDHHAATTACSSLAQMRSRACILRLCMRVSWLRFLQCALPSVSLSDNRSRRWLITRCFMKSPLILASGGTPPGDLTHVQGRG